MEEFIAYVARRLVEHPDDVVVSREDKDEKIVFRLKVSEPDVGKVIGRSGRTAQALRILLTAVAAREGKRAILEITD
jgi:predicted RNA-binding protein YlqC (UPF0109 family)